MASASAQHADFTAGWKASIALAFARRGDRTILAEKRQHGPLVVQRSFHPEGDVCHLYLLHPPGGVAGGDHLDVQVAADSGSRALITTPGAAKFYRSIGPTAYQNQQFHIAGGSLEWLPQENIFFPGARVQMHTEINLSDGANYIGWEMHSLGRPVIGERFTHGSLVIRTTLRREGRPLLLDRLAIDGEQSLNGTATLRGQPVVATLIATGVDSKVLEAAREMTAGPEVGITRIAEILVCRYLGDSTEDARKHFIRIWQVIRPLLTQRPATLPRIWAT
ncbi:MAG: urease accessory protein UreD [Rhodothermales bacterium]